MPFLSLVLKRFSLIFIVFLLVSSCREEEGELKTNEAPETTFSIEEFNLSGDDRLNSIVRLSWYGKDPDGYVVAFELSKDGVNWERTNQQDSTFQFPLDGGTDTADIQLYVRAIDNLGLADASPDFVSIPIKNTPPKIAFDDELTVADTAFIAATTEWDASDLDGNETITEVQISVNGKAWFSISQTKKIFTLVPVDPTVSDTVSARIYYDTDENPASGLVEGLVVNDTNKIYIRAIDQAGTVSELDTSTTFYLKGKVNDVLVVSGVSGALNRAYARALDSAQIPIQYDYLSLLASNGIYRPKLWNVTFKLALTSYDKLFFYSNEDTYLNSYTNISNLLLEFAAPSLQAFANQGGKYFISTAFGSQVVIDGFVGLLPIRSKASVNTTNAFLMRDSSLVAQLPNFPDIVNTQFAVPSIGVFNIDSADTEVLYTAEITEGIAFPPPGTPWTDTRIIASGRRVNGKLNQVFFACELYDLRPSNQQLSALFHQVFNEEFD